MIRFWTIKHILGIDSVDCMDIKKWNELLETMNDRWSVRLVFSV